jgi:hypothetical protein
MIDKLIKNLRAKIAEAPEKCYFNDEADYSNLSQLEDQHNFAFPLSYTTFICSYNGGFIAGFDPAKKIDIESQAWNSNTFLSLNEIEEALDRISYKQSESDKIFIPFLRTSTGEFLAFKWPYESQESKVYDIWHEASLDEWEQQVVYQDFLELLKDYIDKNGKIDTIA